MFRAISVIGGIRVMVDGEVVYVGLVVGIIGV